MVLLMNMTDTEEPDPEVLEIEKNMRKAQLKRVGLDPFWTADPGTRSARESGKVAWDSCKYDFEHCVLASNKRPGMYIVGNVGTGKTWLAQGIALAAFNEGQSVKIITEQEYFDEMRLYYAEGKGAGTQYNQTLADLDVLIIDDLGKYHMTEAQFNYFFTLLDRRISRGKITIITTNLTRSKLGEKWASNFGESSALAFSDSNPNHIHIKAILSRLQQLHEVPMYGQDRRMADVG